MMGCALQTSILLVAGGKLNTPLENVFVKRALVSALVQWLCIVESAYLDCTLYFSNCMLSMQLTVILRL